ncbi:Mu-like prophage protein gp45 (plasmid) [Piscirickettsia salmonis]|uniref:Gp138 family membrane-puncturing spike protein n=1 Tax=Piscirickettsia salmonis TaxID=1238 RepID=UPI0012B966A4|nr:Gp138 family membrane-puncturing spike protein [Piscirickettsia salmonis]QGP52530.1 Mu-like prophage protein gp45 [Piscirickettsia salmonis]
MTNTLEQVLHAALESRLCDVHTSIPGRIASYDATTQKANIQPVIKKKLRDGRAFSMPVITDIPVMFPSAGGGLLSFPAKQGDTGLLFFCERSIDQWMTGNNDEAEPLWNHKHNYTDAVFIPGLYPYSKTLEADPVNTELKFSDNQIILKPDGSIVINAPKQITINTINAYVNASQQLTVTAPLSQFKGNVAITGDLTTPALTATAGSKASSFTGNVKTSGTINCDQTITASSDVVGGGISLKSHTHGGVQTGGGTTSAPQ